MRRRDLLTGLAGAALAQAIGPALARAAAMIRAPVTPKRPVRIEQLGRVRIDDYAWLKPDNWKAVWRDASALDPAIAAYLEDENRYCDAVLAPTLPLQAQLKAEMTRRTAPDIAPPPQIDGAFAYLTRFGSGAQQPSHWRRAASGGPETLLVDGQARAAGQAFFHLLNPTHSRDQTLFAWAEDISGAEKFTIYIKDLATGAVIEGPHDGFGDFVISPDSRWLFWTWRDASSRPARIYRRPIRGGADVLVYEEADPAFLIHLSLSGSGRYIFIRAWNDVTSEVRLIDARAPEAAPVLVEPRQTGHLYSLEHWTDRFAILTNSDGAEDFKLMLASETTPQRAFWRAWTPEQRGRTIIEMRAFARHFVRIDRVEGNPTLVVSGPDGQWAAPLGFSEPAYTLALEPSDYAADTLRFTFESPRTPKQWIDCDMASGRRTVIARQPVPTANAPDGYVVRRTYATAADGARVPITLLHKAGLRRGRPAPLMLTGYGAYGASYETGFSIPNLSLADRGWIWAVAHVRGGSEEGRGWFDQARKLGKTKSFSDFIACAEHLIAAGETAKGAIVAHGYSAGGLLVGAVENLRPDLWSAVIGQAPFVDMLNTMSDAAHPLAPLTRPVWGDPLANPADYDNIAGYSPYDNVTAKPYPATLATTAVADDRVGFWEPAKWIARLRAKSVSGEPMLLHTQMHGGHGGAGGRLDELAEISRMYAFAIWATRRL
jgi:oligopeptidase B